MNFQSFKLASFFESFQTSVNQGFRPILLVIFAVFLSVFLPVLAAFLDQPIFKIVPLLFFIGFFSFFVFVAKIKLTLFFYFLILAVLYAGNFAFSERHPWGFPVVLCQAVIISLILQCTWEDRYFREFIRYVSIGFVLIYAWTFIEWALILYGYQPLMVDILGSESVRGYKWTNSAAFFNFLFGEETFVIRDRTYYGLIFGANGPSLGSQSLSQLMLMGTIWFTFLPYERGTKIFQIIWVLITIFFLASCATMTVTITGFIILTYLIVFDRKTFFGSLWIRGLAILGIIFFSEKIFRLVFYRIRNSTDLADYLSAYNMLYLFDNLTFTEFLFGAKDDFLYYADFGFGGLAYYGGLASLILIFGFFTLECLKSHIVRMKAFKMSVYKDLRVKNMWSLNLISMLNVGVCFIGLVHYTPSIELGVGQLFAFFIGFLIFSTQKLFLTIKSYEKAKS